MDYKNVLLNDDWIYITPNLDNVVIINVFDDGKDIYEIYINEWIKFGEWQGKIALFNKYYPEVIIKSISAWKTKQT